MSASSAIRRVSDLYCDRESYAPAKPSREPQRAPKAAKEWKSWMFTKSLMMARQRGEIADRDVVIGLALADFEGPNGDRCFPSIKKIAEKSGATVDSDGGCQKVSRAIASLKGAGLIEVTRRRNIQNKYKLLGGWDLSKFTGPTDQKSQPNLSHSTLPVTESGNFDEERADNRPPIVLDDAMRKIAIESKMDDWAVEDQFKRFLALNKNTRLHHPNAAWAAFCEKYDRPAWLDWEGLPQWCAELWAIADRTFPDERAAERYFYKALKRREMKRKGKGKPKPIGNVTGWWEAVCKAYVPEEPRQQNQSAPRPDGATNLRQESKHNSRRSDGKGRIPDGEGGYVEWNEEAPGSSESQRDWG